MQKLALAITTMLLTFATICLWSATTQAATYEEHCTRRPMVQGMAGEMVTTCELKRVATEVKASPVARKTVARKPGKTVVVARYGARKVSPLRVAALDADGTCGGLPSVCCDPMRGTRVVCGSSTLSVH